MEPTLWLLPCPSFTAYHYNSFLFFASAFAELDLHTPWSYPELNINLYPAIDIYRLLLHLQDEIRTQSAKEPGPRMGRVLYQLQGPQEAYQKRCRSFERRLSSRSCW